MTTSVIRRMIVETLRDFPAANNNHAILGGIFMRRAEVLRYIYPSVEESYSKLIDRAGKESISLFRDPDYELRAIFWGKGICSNIHDHSPGGCVFMVLRGEFTEYHFDRDYRFAGSTLHRKGSLGFSDNSLGYHQIYNRGDRRALSLHLYSHAEHHHNCL